MALDPSSNSDSRHPIESIASDYAESVRGGRRSTIDRVVESNPQHESELRDLLPVIQQLEKARQSHFQRPAGLATLGASRPDRLGDFELVRQIGRGGMGVVFEAVQKSLGRKVALKVLPTSLLADGDQLRRFEREARTAASLHHTNIVPVFGVGEDQGFHYFVMQRIEGHGLDRVLSDPDIELNSREVAELGRQAASALAYAHQQNVLHRDIKPGNLLVNDQLDLWVTDFGVAKAIESEAVTRTGDVVGTLRYMAPEQIVGDADVRSDVYSLGVTLYELLAGRPAVDDTSIREAIVARRPAPKPPPLRQLNPSVPIDLETILHAAMSANPDKRYQTAEALEEDLQHFLAGEPITRRRMPLYERGFRWAKQNPAIASLSAVSLLLLVSIALVSSIGAFMLNTAMKNESANREDAEEIAGVGLGALDQIFRHFTGGAGTLGMENDFSGSPPLSSETAELLKDLIPSYQKIESYNPSEDNAALRDSTLKAQVAIGDIQFNLGSYEAAIEAYSNVLSLPELTPLQIAKLRNQAGFAYRMKDDTESADEQHELAIELLSKDAANSEGELELEQRFELARAHYLMGLRILPGMGPNAMPPSDLLRSHRPTGVDHRRGPPGGVRLGDGRGAPLPGTREVGAGEPGFDPPGRRGSGSMRQPPGPRGLGRGRPGRGAPGGLGPREPLQHQPPGFGGSTGLPRPPGADPSVSSERRRMQKEHQQIAISLLRDLLKQDPENLRYSLALVRSLRQAESKHFGPNSETTLPSERESVAILQRLHEMHPDNENVLFELSEALADQRLAGLEEDVADVVVKNFSEAADNFSALCDAHPNVPKYINAMVHTHFKLGMLRERQASRSGFGEHRELERLASESFRRAVDRYKIVTQKYPEDAPGYHAWYALFLYHYAGNAQKSGLFDQAIDSFRESAEVWNGLARDYPEETVSLHALPLVYTSLGECYEARGKHEAAREAFEEANVADAMRALAP